MNVNGTINSIFDIDLSPKPGKTYWADGNREWREEFICFLLVDRFHDDLARKPTDKPGRQTGFGNAGQLQTVCGGTFNGITRHLDYIRDLGCTALWLSPVFENNAFSYHGYSVENSESSRKISSSDEGLYKSAADKSHKVSKQGSYRTTSARFTFIEV